MDISFCSVDIYSHLIVSAFMKTSFSMFTMRIPPMPKQNTSATVLLHQMYPSRVVAALLVSYLIVYELSVYFFPASAQFHPAAPIALAALFFGGLRLWPAVYVTALFAALVAGMPLFSLLAGPAAVTLQAIVGAYLLRRGQIDPLFRRQWDIFYLIATTLAISLISPTFEALGAGSYTLSLWGHGYVAALACFLIITPFALRWSAKPRFRRPPLEIYETLAVFAVLIAIDYGIFTAGISSLFGVPVVYALLIPLFVISLRLRPRFVTLALVLTSLFAITGVLTSADSGTLNERLFEMELFLIVLATIFYIIASLEEDRRVNTNIMHSHLGTLQNALARISSESNAKNKFIAILAHELRNPLAPIASGIEILKLKSSGDTADAETLDTMADRMDAIRKLLDDLLDISRISEGKVTFKAERVDLAAALKRAVVSTNHHRKELHQSLVFTMPDTPLYVAGDALRLEQIFSNLLTNASKYSDSGDTISLVVRRQDNVVEIEVADEGIGLSPDTLETIFVPFHQVEEGARTKKGLGIGLALVRNFVELHRGTVVAASKGFGHGSRFTVLLPLLLSPEKAPPPQVSARKGLFSTQEQNSLVLVVDDNDGAAGGIGRLLELQGYSVSYAYTGAQAIEKAFDSSPDAILLDVGLPDIDGYTVAKTLRTRGFAGKLIALTGYSAEESRQKGKEAGFDYYLVKPTGLADLKRVLSGPVYLAK